MGKNSDLVLACLFFFSMWSKHIYTTSQSWHPDALYTRISVKP